MPEKKYPNRWTIAIAGVVMQTCLGTVYAWSIFRNPLEDLGFGWTGTEINLAFTLVIVALAFSAALGGYILDTKGPRIVATLSGIFFGVGILITGVATHIGNLWILYLGYCLICGIGLGFGYIVPVATLVKWFPDKRGLITGLAVLGFGMGSGLMSVIVPRMIDSGFSVPVIFYIFGAIFLVAVTLAAQLMVVPPAGYKPAGWTPHASAPSAASGKTLGEAVRSKTWWLLWGMLFINISAGMAVISQARPMAQSFMIEGIHHPGQLAGTLMLIFAFFNTIGRLIWAAISDKIGRRQVFLILFISQASVFLLMYLIPPTSLVLFSILACYIYGCLGGGFATMPAYAADTFGTKYVGRIYGWMLTAWAAAGILGPQLFGLTYRGTGNYREAMLIMAIIFTVALVLPVLAAPKKRQ